MKPLNQNELQDINGGFFEIFIIIGVSYGMYLKLKQDGFKVTNFAQFR